MSVDDLILIHLEHSSRSSEIRISKRKTPKELFGEVRKVTNFLNQNFHLVMEGTPIQENDPGTLESNGFRFGCTVHLVLNSGGGIHAITPLPGHVTLTNKEPCCIMGYDEPDVDRVKMRCNCVFDITSVKTYCETRIEDGYFYFTCANTKCNDTWPMIAVNHVLSAAMTEPEFESFSRNVNANYFKSSLSIKQCPTCKNFIRRDSSQRFLNPNWVVCSVCNDRGFCWFCQKPWVGDRESCGNVGCDGKDARINTLITCKTKTIGKVSGVPEIRCCEKCGTLIQHSSDCKHMHCANCNHDFCFVCLRPKKKVGKEMEWQCGKYDEACSVAPRQTAIFDFLPMTIPEPSPAPAPSDNGCIIL